MQAKLKNIVITLCCFVELSAAYAANWPERNVYQRLKKIMGIRLSALILSGFLFPAMTYAEEIVWVPIGLGDITFFVPLGDAPTPPQSPTPPSPSPSPAPITDGNFLACVNAAKLLNGWVNDSEVTELYCPHNDIYNVAGVDSFVNLERLALGGNFIADVTPITGLTKLKWLHLASAQYNNTIYNEGVAQLSTMPSLENLAINFTYVAPLNFEDAGFKTGFSGFPTGTNDGSGEFHNGAHFDFIVESVNYYSFALPCTFMDDMINKFPLNISVYRVNSATDSGLVNVCQN